MFLLSNFILKNTGVVKSSSAISTYSIAIGMVIYAALYVYILFYHQDKLAFFNTILIYVVSFDLLLSSALYNKQVLDTKNENKNENEMSSEMYDENEDSSLEESTNDELVASDETTNGDSEQETLDDEDDEHELDDNENNENQNENVEYNIPAIVITEAQE